MDSDQASRLPPGQSASRPVLLLLFCLVATMVFFPTTAQTASSSTAGADNNIGVTGRIHFNTQTRDFERTREFYRLLGYTQGVGNFPKTNTHLMARSLGMYDLCTYELDSIEVISIPNGRGTTSIDLIQFAVPFNDAPPYDLPNHLGMAYAALGSSDFDSDYATLKAQGVEFLSEPVGDRGEKFVFMQDPDGVYLKLIEATEPANTSNTLDTVIKIRSMPYIGINVSDFDTALNFYQSLGYTNVNMLANQGTLAEGRAYGLDQPFQIRGADVSLPNGDGNTLRIMQWLEPFNDDPPYPAPINHIGIDRIALAVQDLDAAVDALSKQGMTFLSEIAPCCSGSGQDRTGIINVIDPDGIFVELVGPIAQRPPQPTAAVCTEQARTTKTGNIGPSSSLENKRGSPEKLATPLLSASSDF